MTTTGCDGPRRVLGLAVPGLRVAGADTVAKTFPDFTDSWASMLGRPVPGRPVPSGAGTWGAGTRAGALTR